MKKFLETLKLKWAEYLIEVIVIVLGISISFWLDNLNNQWVIEKERGEIYLGIQQQIKELNEYSDFYLDELTYRMVHYDDILRNWQTYDYKTVYFDNVFKESYGKDRTRPADIRTLYFMGSLGFIPPSETFVNLKNEGKMNMLSNDIVAVINELNSAATYIQDNDLLQLNLRNQMMDVFSDEYSHHFTDDNGEYLIDMLNQMKSDLKMKTIFSHRIRALKFQIGPLGIYKEKLANLKTLIEAKLDEIS